MKVFRSKDGRIGLMKKGSEIVWYNCIQDAAVQLWQSYTYLGNQAPTFDQTKKEISYAVRSMLKHKHVMAEFGVMGTFLFSADGESL
jgi:hypothetical protein